MFLLRLQKQLLQLLVRTTILPAVLIAAIAVALYGPFFQNPLVFDDVNIFDGRVHTQYLESVFRFDLRWLPYATFEWTRALPGPELVWQRLGNLALHLANGAVLFLFLRRLFHVCLQKETMPLQGRAPTQSAGLIWLAFAGAAIFVLHPAAVYGVAYLVQRTILMATLFTLLMWLMVLEGILRNRQLWLLISAIFYGLAVFSKEHAIMAPAVAAALILLVKGPRLQSLKQALPAFLLYGMIGACVVFQLKHAQVIGRAYEPGGVHFLRALADANPGFDPGLAYPLSGLTQSFLFFKYLLIWIVPNPLWMSADMIEPFAMKLVSWPQTAGLICFIVYFMIAVRLLFRQGSHGLLGFAMLGPWLMFATEFSTVRIQETFVIYRSYLWMAGTAACLPFFFRTVAPGRAAAMLIILVAVMLPVTWDRLTTFSDDFLLWNDAARLVKNKQGRPGVERIYLNRGIALHDRGYHTEAIKDAGRALAINPRYIEAFTTRGAALLATGENDRALADFTAAIRLNPAYSQPYLGKGRINELRNDFDAARNAYRIGCRLGSDAACREFKRIASSGPALPH
jgi:tetratricopeptide (TPR) repeat protein